MLTMPCTKTNVDLLAWLLSLFQVPAASAAIVNLMTLVSLGDALL